MLVQVQQAGCQMVSSIQWSVATASGLLTIHDRDDHPSCKTEPSSRVMAQPEAQSSQPEFTAPTALMLPSHLNPLPVIPTLEELPQRVENYITPPQFDGFDGSDYHYAPQVQHYGGHGSFDTLLTAVNAVSSIESPTPIRNDSLVSHLDAKAASMEQQSDHHPPWMDQQFRDTIDAFEQNGRDLPPLSTMGFDNDHFGSLHSMAIPVAADRNHSPSGMYRDPENASNSGSIGPQCGTSSKPDSGPNDGRKRGPRNAVSKNELKGLGLDMPSITGRKRQRTDLYEGPY